MKVYDLRQFLIKTYGLYVGKRIKYRGNGEDTTEYLYEIVALYPHCVQLRDTFSNITTSPCYSNLWFMLRSYF